MKRTCTSMIDGDRLVSTDPERNSVSKHLTGLAKTRDVPHCEKHVEAFNC